MAKYCGDLVEIGIGRETTRGTAVAPTYGLKWSELSLVDMTMMALDESRSGIIEDSRNSHVVGTFAEGEISGPVRDQSIGLLLYSLMGTLTSAVVETTAYEHTINVQEGNQHQSLTIHKKEPNGGFDHPLGVVNSMEFTAEVDDILRFTSSVRTKSRATQVRTVTYTTENVFRPQDGSFKIAANQAALDAASAVNIRSAKVSINSNVEDDRSLGATAPTDIINRLFAVELEVEIVVSDNTYITSLLAGDTKALRLDFTNTAVTIGASTNPRVRFDVYSAILQEATPEYSVGELTLQTLKYKAVFNETSSKMLVAYVRNLVTSY